MACGQPTVTLYETLSTATTGPVATISTVSLSTQVVSGTFLSSLCASSAGGICVTSTPQILSFTYTTVATNQVILTTRPVITTTEAVPTRTLTAQCVASETTLPNGSVTTTSVYVTLGGSDPNPPTGDAGGSTSNSNNGPIIGGVVGGVVAVLILIAIISVLWRRNRKLAQQIKANDEEEKRNGIINVEELLPSPYVQYPPSFSPTPLGHVGYPPSHADAYRLSAASPESSSYMISPNSHAFGDQVAALVAGTPVVATTQYTPTHSRDGSFSTQAPGHPPSAVLTGVDQRPLTPSSTSLVEGSPTGVPSATNAKAREAFQHRRRSALYAQNPGGGEGEEDIIMPSNATALRSTVPPSAWGAPPPAYTPDT